MLFIDTLFGWRCVRKFTARHLKRQMLVKVKSLMLQRISAYPENSSGVFWKVYKAIS